MWKLVVLTLLGISSVSSAETLQEFRQGRVESLKKNWLVVTGLTWLKPGVNTIGSDTKSDIDLPAAAPASLGKITFADKKTSIVFDAARFGANVVTVNGKPVKAGTKYDLIPDTQPNKTVVAIGGIEFFMIDRPNGTGVRIKDPNADTLKNFKGLNWWPEEKKYVIEGQWKELNPPKVLRIPDVLGNTEEAKITGSVVFKIDGQSYELFPQREKDELFFVFKDTTSGKESYGTGRFLYATLGKDGKVVMDFNRAYNPPCAQIKFATCPLPPPENKLNVAIAAGEKTPPNHH